MRRSRLDAARLQNLNAASWSSLLERKQELQDVRVTAVEADSIEGRSSLTRFTLTLEGYSDAITLIGKETNAREAQFYEEIGLQIPYLTPRCWFSEADEEEGWIVIDDVPNDFAPQQWSVEQLEEVIDELAFLHAVFWGRRAYLESFSWLPAWLSKPRPQNLLAEPRRGRGRPLQHGEGQLVSEHALRSAGQLAPQLLEAATGVELLRELGGWPGVVEESHLAAAADLLDDPLPVLEPLRLLPVTLLHGDPSVYHWHLTLFDDCRLLDWRKAWIGPAVCDLVGFLTQFDLIREPDGAWRLRQPHERPALEETMIDSYILRMSGIQGMDFDARQMRRALPAARCLYMLTDWFARFAAWFSHLPNGRETWGIITGMDEPGPRQSGFPAMLELQPYLAGVFSQFLAAYRSL